MKPIETMKNLVKRALRVGTPPAKKVLYAEIVKKEQSHISKAKKATPAKKAVTPKKKIVKKTTTKKTTPKKEKVETIKAKAPAKKKVSTAKKAVTPKAKTVKKTKIAPKMTKKEEKIALYTKDIQKHYDEVDEAFLAIIVKNLGPSIYRKNAEMVSCADPKELDTVRRNFLVKKLGMSEEKEILDGFIQDVCQELKGVSHKYRATFYYRLAKNLKKESALS